MAAKNARKLIAENLHPDSLGKNKAGNLVARWGFFYTHGRTAEGYVTKVTALLTEAGIAFEIVDSGEVWKDFRGGASVANQSHFYVEIKLVTVPPMIQAGYYPTNQGIG